LVSFHPVVLKIFKFFNKSEAMAAWYVTRHNIRPVVLEKLTDPK